MPATLATFRAWLRLDLNDPASSAPRFADADLDRAVERAVAEHSQAHPYVRDQTLVTTPDSRDVSLASLSGLWAVEEVEWPVGQYPPALVDWRLSPDRQTLTLLVPTAPVGEQVRVRWASRQVLDGAGSTIAEPHEVLIALGAYGFACLAYSTPSADNFKYEDGATAAQVDDTMIALEWRRRSDTALGEFRSTLTRLAVARTFGARGRAVWSRK
ncbi:MAG: hypothetical protein HY332_10590 [Chloroflexi bacterium]|nr:hypothetical protein [Chloroflexota bacterium]